jgi:hypothetical protein
MFRMRPKASKDSRSVRSSVEYDCIIRKMGDLLDLKAEVVSLKNRLFTADQKRMEDLGLKQQTVVRLESQLREE